MKSVAKLIKRSHPVIRKQRPVRYRFIFYHWYSLYLMVFHLFPRYLYHFLKRPYCRAIPTLDYQLALQSIKQPGAELSHLTVPMEVGRRFRIKRYQRDRPVDALSKLSQKVGAISLRARGSRASFDTLLSFAVDAYVKKTGAKIIPETGQIALLSVQFVRYLDNYLDKCHGGGTVPTMHEILAVPEIIEQIVTIYRYLEPFSCVTLVIKYLWQLLATYYDSYRNAFNLAMSSLQFEDVLEVVKLDSGMASRAVMEVVCLFNEYQIDDDILNDFYLFGMIGKFCDDMADLVGDIVKKGSPNLFYALTRQNPEEYVRLQLAIQQEGNASVAWCKKHCPLTFMRYLEYIEHYYQQIQSSEVRKLSLLLFAGSYHRFGTNTLIGGDLDIVSLAKG